MDLFKLEKMKNFLIIFIVLAFKTGYSQIPIEQETEIEYNRGTNFKDVNGVFDKFLGTWVFDDGVDYFKVTFSLQEDFDWNDWGSNPTTYDTIVSRFLYKKNGIIIYDTYNNFPNSNYNPSFDHIIYGYHFSGYVSSIGNSFDQNVNTNNLLLGYSEPTNNYTRCRNAAVKISYSGFSIGSNGTTINWERTFERLESCSRQNTDGSLPDNSDFLIPSTMILVKQ